MEYRYLTNTPIETVQQCMQDSFADYQLDMSYMTAEVMKHRNAICRNHPEFSVGAFDGEKMVGLLCIPPLCAGSRLLEFIRVSKTTPNW